MLGRDYLFWRPVERCPGREHTASRTSSVLFRVDGRGRADQCPREEGLGRQCRPSRPLEQKICGLMSQQHDDLK